MADTVKRVCREAYTRDVSRGVIRIDYDTMDELKINTGDIVEIKGKRKSVAKAMPLYPADESKNMMRTDSLIRDNAGIEMGHLVQISKTESHPALSILVEPLEAYPDVDARYLADAMGTVPVCKGDRFMVPFFGGRINFRVIKTTPKGNVVVNQKTKFIFKDPKDDLVTCPTCGSKV